MVRPLFQGLTANTPRFPLVSTVPGRTIVLHVLTPLTRVKAPPLLAALPPREHLYAAVSFAADGAEAPGRFSAWAAHTAPLAPPILSAPRAGLLHPRRYVSSGGSHAHGRQKAVVGGSGSNNGFGYVYLPLWGRGDLCKLVGRYPTLNNIACYTVAVNRKFWGVVFWLPLMARRSAAGLTGAAQRRRSGATPTPTGPGAGGLRKRPKGPL